MSDYDLETIGVINGSGNRVHVSKRFRTSNAHGICRVFEGFLLEGDECFNLEGGGTVKASVFIPKDALHRIIGLLESEVKSQERIESTKKV